MRGQRTFFLVIIGISVLIAVLNKDVSIISGFIPFGLSLFTLSSVSYDSFDNGNAFLFTLPFSRRTYVSEKYVLALLLAGIGWVISIIIGTVVNSWVGYLPLSELMLVYLMILPLIFIVEALMLPIQLKFGGEKGRLALIIVMGIIALFIIAAVKVAEMMQVDVYKLLDLMASMSLYMFFFILSAIAGLLMLISFQISVRIMEKKELV